MAIRDGRSAAGEWHICKKDGAVYFAYYHRPVAHGAHAASGSLRVPALYPDGCESLRRVFCAWARKLPRFRAELLLALARGERGSYNQTGDAIAVPAIVGAVLTRRERAAWAAFVTSIVDAHIEGCLTELNNASRRARYRFVDEGAPAGTGTGTGTGTDASGTDYEATSTATG